MTIAIEMNESGTWTLTRNQRNQRRTIGEYETKDAAQNKADKLIASLPNTKIASTYDGDDYRYIELDKIQ